MAYSVYMYISINNTFMKRIKFLYIKVFRYSYLYNRFNLWYNIPPDHNSEHNRLYLKVAIKCSVTGQVSLE